MKENKKTLTKKQVKTATTLSPQVFSRQLNRDVRDSVLVISVLINVYFLAAWLTLQVSDRFDAALIGYLQNQ